MDDGSQDASPGENPSTLEPAATPSNLQEEAPAAAEAQAGPPVASCSHLRLRGLPFQAGMQEVEAFFQQKQIPLRSVLICKRNGRSTGEAYVELESPDLAPAALTLHRSTMGSRYVEIFESTKADFATAKALSVDRMKGYVVRLRGLPFSASATDVIKFLGDVEVVRGLEGVIFTWTPDGRPTGEAFVELKDEEAQREAMKRHKEVLGNRYIELFTSTKADLVQAIQHNRLILGFASRKRWLQQAGLPYNTVMMPGMPPHGFQGGPAYMGAPGALHVAAPVQGLGMLPGQVMQPGRQPGGMVTGAPHNHLQFVASGSGAGLPGHQQQLQFAGQLMGMPQPQQQHQLGGQQQHHRGGGRGRGGQLRHGGSGFMASQGSGSGLGDLVAGMQGMQLGGRSGLRGQQDHLGGGAFTAQDLSGAGQAGFMLAGGSGAGSSTRGGGQGQGVTVLGAGPSQVAPGSGSGNRRHQQAAQQQVVMQGGQIFVQQPGPHQQQGGAGSAQQLLSAGAYDMTGGGSTYTLGLQQQDQYTVYGQPGGTAYFSSMPGGGATGSAPQYLTFQLPAEYSNLDAAQQQQQQQATAQQQAQLGTLQQLGSLPVGVITAGDVVQVQQLGGSHMLGQQ